MQYHAIPWNTMHAYQLLTERTTALWAVNGHFLFSFSFFSFSFTYFPLFTLSSFFIRTWAGNRSRWSIFVFFCDNRFLLRLLIVHYSLELWVNNNIFLFWVIINYCLNGVILMIMTWLMLSNWAIRQCWQLRRAPSLSPTTPPCLTGPRLSHQVKLLQDFLPSSRILLLLWLWDILPCSRTFQGALEGQTNNGQRRSRGGWRANGTVRVDLTFTDRSIRQDNPLSRSQNKHIERKQILGVCKIWIKTVRRPGSAPDLASGQPERSGWVALNLFLFVKSKWLFFLFSDSLFGFASYLYLYLNLTFELMMVFAEAGGRLETRWWQQAGQGQTQMWKDDVI